MVVTMNIIFAWWKINPAARSSIFPDRRHWLEGRCVPWETRGWGGHSCFQVAAHSYFLLTLWLLLSYYVCCYYWRFAELTNWFTVRILGLEVSVFCFIINSWAQEASLTHPGPWSKCLLLHGQGFRSWEDLGPVDSLSVQMRIFIPRNKIPTP